MMDTVYLRLQGPMQAWGTAGRFDVRDTAPWPTKSGVVGLVAAAMGIDRFGDITAISQLRMGVAVLSSGTMSVDYHTAIMSARSGAKPSDTTAQSWRSFISDGDFLVALTGEDSVVANVRSAIVDPVWPLYLGRRAVAPSIPVAVAITTSSNGDLRHNLLEVVRQVREAEAKEGEASITLVLECDESEATTTIPDQPLATFAERLFAKRAVQLVVDTIAIVPTQQGGNV